MVRHSRLAGLVALAVTTTWLTPQVALARKGRKGDEVEAEGPKRPEGPPPLGELSAQGTDNGALELGLGTTSVLVTAALIAHGTFQIFEGRRKSEICKGFTTDPPECNFDGPNLRYAGAGLSFAFAVPVAVGAALFLRKGIRINRDYKAYRKANPGEVRSEEEGEAKAPRLDGVDVWVHTRSRRAFGLGLSLRF